MTNQLDFTSLYTALDTLTSQLQPPSASNSPEPFVPLFLEPASCRHIHSKRRAGLVQDLEGTLAALQIAQDKIEALRSRVTSWRGCLTYSSAPLGALPVELLRQIFEYTVTIDSSDSSSDLDSDAKEEALVESSRRVAWLASLRLSHVTSRWRDITIACPKLWTCLDVSSKSQTHLIDLFVSRLGHLKMHLSLHGNYRPTTSSGSTGNCLPSFYLSPAPHIIRKISSLRITKENSSVPWFSTSSCDGFAHEIGSVTFIECENANLDPFTSSIRTLSLTESSIVQTPSSPAPIHVFARLENLSFSRMKPSDILRLLSNDPIVRLPHLRHLEIEEDITETRAFGTVMDRPLRGAAFTELESLNLRACSHLMLIHLGDASMPRLKMLELSVPDRWTEGDVFDRVRSFLTTRGSTLKLLNLNLRYTDWGAVSVLRNPIICPSLLSLRISYLRSSPSTSPTNAAPALSEAAILRSKKTIRKALEERISSPSGSDSDLYGPDGMHVERDEPKLRLELAREWMIESECQWDGERMGEFVVI